MKLILNLLRSEPARHEQASSECIEAIVNFVQVASRALDTLPQQQASE